MWQGRKIECKLRSEGFKELYNWLKVEPKCGKTNVKRQQDAPDFVFCRANEMPWLMVRVLSVDEMKVLDADSV